MADAMDPRFAGYQALLIGLSAYKHDQQMSWGLGKLPQADRDALRVKRALCGVGYDPRRLHCLCNEDATREKIIEMLLEMRHNMLGGLILIFWAGHGICDRFRRNRLLPWEAEPDQAATLLTLEDLATLTGGPNLTPVALFLDTCHAVPKSMGLVRPRWQQSSFPVESPVVLFAGASTFLAAENGCGGLLAQSLTKGLEDPEGHFADKRGLVDVNALVLFLQGEMGRHAEVQGFQYPLITSNATQPIWIGRNWRIHARTRLAEDRPSQVLGTLADRILDRSLKRGL